MMHDLSDRPFIYVGFIAFFGLFSLALTSNKRTKIYMGPKRWKRLHQAVYFVAILGVIHFYILVKSSDVTEPLLFASVLFLLLGFRLFEYFRR
jgi:sulfoxide reductase heme-binding subunit YedZ